MYKTISDNTATGTPWVWTITWPTPRKKLCSGQAEIIHQSPLTPKSGQGAKMVDRTKKNVKEK